ncbi:DUF7856 family protein [Halosegnis longus]|uniref:DUF7856 family protein n=1 Tax=Halosegnis longus TaxID=2216012 RepID=UPI00096A5236|nr:hypothetical protein [Salella cibi]
MRLRLTDSDRVGRAVDCRGADVDPTRVLAAVRDPTDDGVRCRRATPLHETLGAVGFGSSPSRRQTLAAVARSRGIRVPEQEALAAARDRLAAHTTESTTLAPERERVASASHEDRGALREEVARLRGVVDASRDGDGPSAETLAEYRETAARLSEVGTTATAAREKLTRERERRSERYDAHQRRLELEDAVANRERDARQALADQVTPRVARARDALAETTLLDPEDDRTRRLAAVRVARLSAPVVVAGGSLDASELARVTRASVVRCRDL